MKAINITLHVCQMCKVYFCNEQWKDRHCPLCGEKLLTCNRMEYKGSAQGLIMKELKFRYMDIDKYNEDFLKEIILWQKERIAYLVDDCNELQEEIKYLQN